MLTYGEKLNHALVLLGGIRSLGTKKGMPDTQALLCRSHVIVYRTRQGVTEVVRILHQRMSITKHV